MVTTSGSSTNPTWSPHAIVSTTRPTNQLGQPSRTGTPCGPSSQVQAANLSTESPVSPPKSSARTRALAGARVHGQMAAVPRHGIGVVLHGQAHEEARRGHRGLRREADRAAGPLRSGASGHDGHRLVDLGDEILPARGPGSADTASYPVTVAAWPRPPTAGWRPPRGEPCRPTPRARPRPDPEDHHPGADQVAEEQRSRDRSRHRSGPYRTARWPRSTGRPRRTAIAWALTSAGKSR